MINKVPPIISFDTSTKLTERLEPMKPTKQHAEKIIEVMSHGICRNIGKPIPGQMCILAVKRYVFGLSHGDKLEGLPIGSAVRSFDIALNDVRWSSNQARAKGMARLGVAELGSDEIDQSVFVKELTLSAIRLIIPIALRAAAKRNPSHAVNLEAHAVKCEQSKDLLDGRENARASKNAADVAAAAAYAAADVVAAYAAAYVAAAYAAAYAAADVVAAYVVAAYAAADVVAAYAAADVAAAYAAADVVADVVARDEVLGIMAEAGVQALIKAGSPGAQWLDLVK